LAGAAFAATRAFQTKLRRYHFFPNTIARLSPTYIAELKMDPVEDPGSSHFVSCL
jgi:hypothetical protein